MFALHEDVGIFRRLIPPWERVEILDLPASLQPGTRALMRLRWGPLSILWEAVHCEYDPPRCFSDEQARGPFACWRHRHVMEPADGGCVLRDEVDYRLPLHPLTAWLCPLVDRRLRRMFAFRHRVTGELLAARREV